MSRVVVVDVKLVSLAASRVSVYHVTVQRSKGAKFTKRLYVNASAESRRRLEAVVDRLVASGPWGLICWKDSWSPGWTAYSRSAYASPSPMS